MTEQELFRMIESKKETICSECYGWGSIKKERKIKLPLLKRSFGSIKAIKECKKCNGTGLQHN